MNVNITQLFPVWPNRMQIRPTERAKDDYESVVNILDHCNIEALSVEVYRMGKRNDKFPRLVKVKLPTRTPARQLINNKRRLNVNDKFQRIRVCPSMTREERAERQFTKKSRNILLLFGYMQHMYIYI